MTEPPPKDDMPPGTDTGTRDVENPQVESLGAASCYASDAGVYPVQSICNLPVGEYAGPGTHLWLWTDNRHLPDGFKVMEAWGFKYHAPVTWVKPSGAGMWFLHRTQTLLFGYRSPLKMVERYKPTVFEALPGEHSAKPFASYELIEAVSDGPRLEVFARPWTPMFPKREG